MWSIWAMMLMLQAALHGCDSAAAPPVQGNVANVIIHGKPFKLDIRFDEAGRNRGMGGRTTESIPDDGGMIFTFPSHLWGPMQFVMRDCPSDLDILYLDGGGRVLTMYTMKALPPRKENEGKDGEYNADYETRVTATAYPSRYSCVFVIELKPGTIKKLGIQEGEKIEFDMDALKKMAR
jgi:uncharacterized membrane protein (UPF0127 family)